MNTQRRPESCRFALFLFALGLIALPHTTRGDDAPGKESEKPAAEKVELPGISIDSKKKRIDVDAKVALENGLLELIACTKDSKEHESLVVVEAAPVHIHAALLLIGANNGHPAMVKPANEERTEWLHLPPRGDPVTISLVYPDPKNGKKTIERPISDFLKRTEGDPAFGQEQDGDAEDGAKVFDTFVFAGSVLLDREDGEREYLADVNGNVVSISTFGDEVLCLPAQISQDNAALIWSVNGKYLPKAGTKVKLRITLKELPEQEEQE